MFGIQKVGEGFSGPPEHLIPIDIHHHRLLEWLVDRKKISADWTEALRKINLVSVKEALPKTENYKSFVEVDPSQLDYLYVLKLKNQLENDPGIDKSKSLFGTYNNAALAQVHTALASYRKNSLFLAEVARSIISNVNYAAPAIKKQIDSYVKQIRELERKESETAKNASEFDALYISQCRDLAIDPQQDVLAGLTSLASNLTQFHEDIAKACQSEHVQELIEFYKQFVAFLGSESENSLGHQEEICGVLCYVSKYGNDTVENMEKRKKGEEIVDLSLSELENQPGKDNNAQDAAEINWDVDIPSEVSGGDQVTEVANVNWDISGENIDWDISAADENNSGIVSVSDNVGSDDEKHSTVLANRNMRARLLDDIYELHEFYKRRILEMSSNQDSTLVQLFETAPISIRTSGIDTLRKYADKIRGLLKLLENERFVLLTEIKASHSYAQRIASSIKEKSDTAMRLRSSISLMNARRFDLSKLIEEKQKEYTKVVENTKELKKIVEEEISQQYNGRIVNIVGEINNLIGAA